MAYTGYTPAHNNAHKKYMQGHVEVRTRVTAEQRDAIRVHAAARGESVNAFIGRAITEAMERDNAQQDNI